MLHITMLGRYSGSKDGVKDYSISIMPCDKQQTARCDADWHRIIRGVPSTRLASWTESSGATEARVVLSSSSAQHA
jgi:hypothetical protein